MPSAVSVSAAIAAAHAVSWAMTSIPAQITNTTVRTAFANKATVAAGTVKVGQTIRVIARGLYWTDIAAIGTLTLSIDFGATTILATAAITPLLSASARAWEVELIATVLTLGTSGTVECQGRSAVETVADVLLMTPLANSGVKTVNTTVAMDITINAKWSAALGPNKAEMRAFLVEIVNAQTDSVMSAP